jgi:hypothetical protein
MKKKNEVTYIANGRIYSLQHKSVFYPGERITWDLEGEFVPDFDALVDMGALSPVEKAQPEEAPDEEE